MKRTSRRLTQPVFHAGGLITVQVTTSLHQDPTISASQLVFAKLPEEREGDRKITTFISTTTEPQEP